MRPGLSRLRALALAAALAAAPLAANAGGTLLELPTREGVTTTVFWEPAHDAHATLLLFPGGDGGFGRVEDGVATSRNFLVRIAPLLVGKGFNVAIFGRPSDSQALDYADRVAEPHVADMRHVLDALRARSPAPIWALGTSRGTISATAAAIRLPGSLAGLVLTSSVVHPKKPGAVPGQDLAAIRLPVLVLHHARDACPVCRPDELPSILRGLTRASVKKLVLVDGGHDPTGDVCAALHWHGFIGMEPEAAGLIADWVRHPIP